MKITFKSGLGTMKILAENLVKSAYEPRQTITLIPKVVEIWFIYLVEFGIYISIVIYNEIPKIKNKIK